MNDKLRNFLTGVGSVVDIFPRHDIDDLVPHRNAAELMASHFTNVGGSISRACKTFAEENPSIKKIDSARH